jgi:hypothetical protein
MTDDEHDVHLSHIDGIETKLTRNTWVNLGTVVAVCVFISAQSYFFGTWKSKVEMDVSRIPPIEAAIDALVVNQIELTATVKQLANFNIRITDNEKKIGSIRANRFTSFEGKEMMSEISAVWKEIAHIKEQVAGIPKETPPAWFLERVNKLEDSVEKLSDSLLRMHNDVLQIQKHTSGDN